MAISPICRIEDCGKKTHKGSSLCSMHQARVRIHGSPHLGARKEKSSCTIDGCEGQHLSKGFCLKHYKRWYKYGDPLAGSIGYGEAQRFIHQVAKTTSDECIPYPFYRTQNGYGWMRSKNGPIGSHVNVAIIAHGPKPTPKHQACHTCGNGHLGCVNPNHIYWGTRSDNMKDAYKHGTAFGGRYGLFGEEANSCRYSDEKIALVKSALDGGETQMSISKRLGISQSHISRIKHGTRSPLSHAAPRLSPDHK